MDLNGDFMWILVEFNYLILEAFYGDFSGIERDLSTKIGMLVQFKPYLIANW